MKSLQTAQKIRSFIGAKDYAASRRFYRALGFEEVEISKGMCLFKVNETMGFYLQDAYVKDWVDNLMIFLEVPDIEGFAKELQAKDLAKDYKLVRISPIQTQDWGRVIYMHDPSGVLWHFGKFS